MAGGQRLRMSEAVGRGSVGTRRKLFTSPYIERRKVHQGGVVCISVKVTLN